MKEPHANEQTSLGVLMTPAQKAAELIGLTCVNEAPQDGQYIFDDIRAEAIIQSTLDAAVEQEREKYLKLAAECRDKGGRGLMPEERTVEEDAWDAVATELEALAKEK